ncbi:ferritin-like domain-containing protein [Myxococcota bacterium]|nr:ferritin-like domain-containing protein [Myxococcota bacterium]
MLGLLRVALGAELFALARTKRCYYAAVEAKDLSFGEVLLEQAVVQAVHADQLVERITELGGAPDFSPRPLQPLGAPEGARPCDVLDVRAALASEVARRTRGLEHQRALVAELGDDDARARTILERIVAREEEQTRSLSRLLG